MPIETPKVARVNLDTNGNRTVIQIDVARVYLSDPSDRSDASLPLTPQHRDSLANSTQLAHRLALLREREQS
jgi:hypothetical protein